jgi:LysM repeat protein
MKHFSSRYAQIGLALIVAILLLAGISTSASAAGPVYHTVKYGQTVYSIAQWYHTSVWAIACANGLYNPNYVYAGQVLVIPGGHDGKGCKPAHKEDYGHDSHKDYGQDHEVSYGGYDQKKDYGHDQKKDYGHDQKDYGQGQGEYGNDHQDYGKDREPVKYHEPEYKKLGCYYTVRWGDHLFRIALRYNISWTVIAQANGLHNGNYIYAGQVLRVPCVW